MQMIFEILTAAWGLLLASAPYMLFGLLAGGWLKVFLDPGTVARHFGRGRFASVFKAALFGIPIPLCSCGVLPAALTLKRQGASNGATTAFMIATPESGVDSIAITYALLDPIMTVARPLAAFATAALAGTAENVYGRTPAPAPVGPLLTDQDGCAGPDADTSRPGEPAPPSGFIARLRFGLAFSFRDFWGDLAGWFFLGLFLAGLIAALMPDDVFGRYLGEGLPALLLMLAVSVPLYICATASTPVAAALVLKGVSPGAALVFLLAGPATNMTTLTVLAGVLGRRATAIYLGAIVLCAVGFGLLLDGVYGWFGISARAAAGQAAELMPAGLELAAAVFLLIISVKPLGARLQRRLRSLRRHGPGAAQDPPHCGPT